jgi:hypothetical protein
MPRFTTLTRVLLVAVAAIAIAAEARADLKIRASSFDSGGILQTSDTRTVLRSDPPPSLSSINETFTTLDDFSLVITVNTAQTNTGITSHALLINLTYTGGTGTNSSSLVVEFIGLDYINPSASPPAAFVFSDASPSTSGLIANSVTMVSGVFTGNDDLPGTIGDTSGLSGATSQSGTMGAAASVLTPNPALGNPFDLTGQFSFYQVLSFGAFQNTNFTGNISAGTNVSAIPEPGTMAMAAMAMPLLAIGFWRRRRQAQA